MPTTTQNLPPPPITSPPGSREWNDWFRLLQIALISPGSISWGSIDFTGSDLDDIAAKNHNILDNLQGGTSGEYYHLTTDEHNSRGQIETYTVATSTSEIIGTEPVTSEGVDFIISISDSTANTRSKIQVSTMISEDGTTDYSTWFGRLGDTIDYTLSTTINAGNFELSLQNNTANSLNVVVHKLAML